MTTGENLRAAIRKTDYIRMEQEQMLIRLLYAKIREKVKWEDQY
jgi:hypothetical protein